MALNVNLIVCLWLASQPLTCAQLKDSLHERNLRARACCVVRADQNYIHVLQVIVCFLFWLNISIAMFELCELFLFYTVCNSECIDMSGL